MQYILLYHASVAYIICTSLLLTVIGKIIRSKWDTESGVPVLNRRPHDY